MFGGYQYRSRNRASRQGRIISLVAAGCGIAMLTAGCGLIRSSTASNAATPNSSSAARNAYLNCLRQHSVNIPTARPTPGSGGFGGGGFGGANGTFAQARQACAALRPSGGFGGRFASAIRAFRSCMSAHGVTIPATRPATPPAPGAGRFLNGLDPSNPKVAAALKACQSKLPSFPSGASLAG